MVVTACLQGTIARYTSVNTLQHSATCTGSGAHSQLSPMHAEKCIYRHRHQLELLVLQSCMLRWCSLCPHRKHSDVCCQRLLWCCAEPKPKPRGWRRDSQHKLEPQSAAHPGILHCGWQCDSLGSEKAATSAEHPRQLRVRFLISCRTAYTQHLVSHTVPPCNG